MFLDINKIEPEGRELAVDLRLGSLSAAGGDSIEVRGAHLSGRADRVGDEVELAARLVATLGLGCSRCLSRFEHDLKVRFFLVLVASRALDEARGGEAEVDERDIARFHAEDGKVSLEEIAVEQVYLHLPLKAICRPDCRGLCPDCGVDRNKERCDCERETLDPRLAPLLELNKHGTAG